MKSNYATTCLANLLSIFGLLLLNNLYAQTLRFSVKVPEQYVTKDFLALATDNIPTAGRYIVAGGFELDMLPNTSDNYVRSIFETAGIPVISVLSKKSETSFSTEKAGGVNCGSAQLLCSNTSQTANSSGFGVQELNAVNHGCLSGNEHQSSWYYLNVQSGGNLTMNINPNNTADDYDFAIWGPFTSVTAVLNCPPITPPIRCSYSATAGTTGLASMNLGTPSGCGFLGLFPCAASAVTDLTEGASGDRFVMPLVTLPNQIYILLVDNYSNSGNAYNMDFGGTSVLGCTPVVLPVELSSFHTEHSGKNNLLTWTTESEDRSDFFTVEWTTDPVSGNWTEIAKVSAAGESTAELSYSALHSNPSVLKTNYYRLSQTDEDGEITVYGSRIVSAAPEAAGGEVVHIYSLFGQEVSSDYGGIVIYQYTDGSTRKVNQ